MRFKSLTALIIPLLFTALIARVIVNHYDVEDLYDGGQHEDSLKNLAGTKWHQMPDGRYIPFPVLHTAADSGQAYYSNVMPHRAFSDMQINGYFTADSLDSCNMKVEIGLFHGVGYPDSSGYEWKSLFAFTSISSSDTTFQVSLYDSTWWYKFPVSQYLIRVTNVDVNTGGNKFALNVMQFEEE